MVGKPTNRLLIIECPICGTQLQVHVKGLPQTVTSEEWLKLIDDEDRQSLHDGHHDGTLVESRALTRRIVAI